MKKLLLVLLSFSVTLGFSQSLPINFESNVNTSDFIDFDGGAATVVNNPFSSGINTSSKVAQLVRNGGQPWAGSKIQLDASMDFTTDNTIRMKVYTTAPIGTVVKLKFEGASAAERDAVTTMTNAWETLSWDFTATPGGLDNIVFMFDFGNIGDGSANSTFYFDDIEQLFGGYQIDLPVDFQSATVNYTMTDFGDNQSSLVVDPTFASNTVVKVIKPISAAGWAGTTIGTPSGFLNNVPLTLTDSKVNIRVWSPTSGIPIRLKVEASNDNNLTCETESFTTVANEWEVLTFDFAQEATGTAALSFGLANGWTYNKMSIFFNFGVDGATSGEKTYYFDDVKFGAPVLGIETSTAQFIDVYPNPSSAGFFFQSTQDEIETLSIFAMNGIKVTTIEVHQQQYFYNATKLPAGIYSCVMKTSDAQLITRLVKID